MTPQLIVLSLNLPSHIISYRIVVSQEMKSGAPTIRVVPGAAAFFARRQSHYIEEWVNNNFHVRTMQVWPQHLVALSIVSVLSVVSVVSVVSGLSVVSAVIVVSVESVVSAVSSE